jgi:hypothetical protein
MIAMVIITSINVKPPCALPRRRPIRRVDRTRRIAVALARETADAAPAATVEYVVVNGS